MGRELSGGRRERREVEEEGGEVEAPLGVAGRVELARAELEGEVGGGRVRDLEGGES